MFQNRFKKFGASIRCARVIGLVLCLLMTLMVPLMQTGLYALAEGTLTAMRMKDRGETGINHSVTVETGKTYTFSVLWKCLDGSAPDFLLLGDSVGSQKTLILADKVQEGAKYDADGRLSYTFVSQGTKLDMYGRMGTGYVNAYFSMPMLYESDANGNALAGGAVIDCNPDFTSWTKWGYGQDCLVSEQVTADFFKRESADPITAMRLHEWSDAGVNHTVTVEQGKTYTFSVLWKYVTGGNPDFLLLGDSVGSQKTLILADKVQEGAKYDADGRLSYTFVSQGTKLDMYARMGAASGERDVYFADMRLYESDAAGIPVPVSAPIDCDADFNNSWVKWGYGGDYRHVVQVDANFFKMATATALTALDVGYTLSPVFDPAIYAYTVTVPYAVNTLTIQPTLAEGASIKEITGNENFEVGVSKDVVIAVNNTAGGVTNYTLTVTRDQDHIGTITAMRLVGKEPAGLSNSMTVENGKTYTASVLYKYVRGVDPSFTLRGDALAGNKLLVECAGVQPGVTYDRSTGKLSYTFTSQGTTLEMFAYMGDKATNEANTAEFYFAEPTLYESDAAGIPVSSGAVIDCDADFNQKDAWEKWKYGGDYRQVVQIAPDFFKAAPATALTALDVGYALSPVFDPAIYTYMVTVPYTVTELTVQHTLAEGASLKEITGNGGFEQGRTKDVLISVNNNQGEITTYTLHVTRGIDPATQITAMRIHEWNDAGVAHTVAVETGKTYTFTFLWKHILGTDNNFRFEGNAVTGGKKLIIADKPQAGVDYDPVTGKVSYTFTSQGAELVLASSMGRMDNAEKDYYFAQPTLYESDAAGNPVAGAAAIDCNPAFDTSWPHWGYGGNYRIVEKVRPDFFEKTDFPHALTSLDIGYAYSPAFDYRRTIYDVTVPYTVKELNIRYTLAENATLQQITGNGAFADGVTKNVVISVNNDAGGVTSYTLRVKREVEPAAMLTTLDVGYALTPAFQSAVYHYTLSVPNGVTTLTVKHTETANSTFQSITGNTAFPVGIPTDVVITVANIQGIETTYTITVTRQGSAGDISAMAAALKEAAAKLNCTNAITADSLKAELQTAIESGYRMAVVEFYKQAAIPGAKDGDGVIVPGADGYVSALINLTDGTQLAELPLSVTIKAPMTTYTFTADEQSKPSDFELEDGGKYLSAYTGSAKKIVIPDSVEEIGFGWNQSDDLGSGIVLVIPDNVKVLPGNLAYGMKHLETVYMGNGTTELPANAFDRCIFLQQVRLSENLKIIGANAFAGTTSLVHLRLPESLETIGANAFFFSLLRDITVPAGVKTIGNGAFASPFSAAFQLIKGSDNMYFMFVFENENDPDLARLKKISNANVDYVDSKGNVYDTLEEAPIGFQWGGDKPWPNGPVYVTSRVVTLLGKDVEIGKDVFYTQNGFYNGGVTARLLDDSSAMAIVKAEIAVMEAKAAAKAEETGEEKAIIGVVAQSLDMTLAEAAARVQFAVNHLILTGESTADSVIAAVKSAYVSTAVKNSPSWKEPFKITETMATGVMELKNDKVAYTIVLNTALSNIVRPDPDQPENPDDPTDPSIPDSLMPLSTIDGSRVVLMDWDGGIMTVLKNTTIAKFLENVKLQDGYTLEFYDNEGCEIFEEYYDIAILEDGFTMRIKKGYSRINEFSFVTADSLPNPHTGDSARVMPALVFTILAAGAVVLRQRKKKEAQ